jgi:hypothetical protein
MGYRLYYSGNQGTSANPAPPKGYFWKMIYCVAWITLGSASGTRTIAILRKPQAGMTYSYYLVPLLSSTLAVSGDTLASVGSTGNSGFTSSVAASESAVWQENVIFMSDSALYMAWGLQTGDVSGYEFLVEELPV